MVDLINDVRIIGMITVIILLAIVFIGMAWEAKVREPIMDELPMY